MPSLLEHDIASQPTVIRELLRREMPLMSALCAGLPPCGYVLIAARGSSDHAALYAKYVWAILAGYPVALAAPSVHTLYHATPRMDGALVIGISQSGQSPDIVAVLEAGRRQGRPTIAITNDPASPLAGVADHVIELGVEAEITVAATKTYTAQLAVIAMLAAAWSGRPERLAELDTLPDALEATLRATEPIAEQAQRYREMASCVVIGRGYNYATAREVALKLKELTYTMATAYSSADFRHGPIATVEPGTPALLCMPSGATYADMRDLAEDLRRRQADLLVISDVAEALSLAQTSLPLPAPVPEWLSPITAVVPGQALALRLALARGFDPDVPRGLHKVTRTL
ncbi:MAG TPA: SIS domain-containing protein [Ktedonobacterales bacterium]